MRSVLSTVITGCVVLYLLVVPLAIVIVDLVAVDADSAAIPPSAKRLHKHLSSRFARWARARVASGQAAGLDTSDISGTEWPLFSAMFYLWSTEALETAWREGEEPMSYAREAVDAAAALVIDPGHAGWVKRHWGERYLEQENVFYRALTIAGLASHARLSGSTEHLQLLRTQVESLSAELAASSHGLLDDYPGQCYPTDVLGAIAAIADADSLLGTDHSTFVSGARRGFSGAALDRFGLVPYLADAKQGRDSGGSRGCSNSYASLRSPRIWPAQAAEWYRRYAAHFWQTRWGAVGFREFPRDMPDHDWYFDVDSGPVIAGHGIAASAFGLGAARTNGRFDHAYPLTLEALVLSWPLPDGRLLVPRILSNAVDAPYLGEVALLYNLSRAPAPGVAMRFGGRAPLLVYLAVCLFAAIVIFSVLGIARGTRRRLRRDDEQRGKLTTNVV